MSRICFVDLDKVVADNLEREMRGRQFVDSRFVPEEGIIPSIVYRDAWQKIFYSERAFYNPEWVKLDTLMEGADEDVDTLRQQGYKITFLTSRPESMREATYQWLWDNNLIAPIEHLIMKAPAFTQAPPNHTYTRVWKAGIVQTFAAWYGADTVLVVDDSPDVRQAVLDAYPEGGPFGLVQVAASLDEAVKLVEGRKR